LRGWLPGTWHEGGLLFAWCRSAKPGLVAPCVEPLRLLPNPHGLRQDRPAGAEVFGLFARQGGGRGLAALFARGSALCVAPSVATDGAGTLLPRFGLGLLCCNGEDRGWSIEAADVWIAGAGGLRLIARCPGEFRRMAGAGPSG